MTEKAIGLSVARAAPPGRTRSGPPRGRWRHGGLENER